MKEHTSIISWEGGDGAKGGTDQLANEGGGRLGNKDRFGADEKSCLKEMS